MATDSITKRFVIKDDATCKKLVDAFENTPTKKKEVKSSSSSFERGKELLAIRYGR